MRKLIFPILLLLLALSSTTYISGQKVVVPEEVKKKCPETPINEKVRLAVARFSNSVSGVNGQNIDNFSSMLSNAMFEIDCFRMLSMVKDSTDNKDADESANVKPQLIITAEITKYNHTVRENTVVFSKKTTIVAHIGFILQIKDPVTRDILFSKSFEQDGSSENKSLVVAMPKSPTPGQNAVSSTTNNSIDKAYFDAFEKGLLQAVTYIVDSRDKIYNIAKGSSDGGTIKTTIVVQNASFPKLMEMEKTLKELKTVTKIEKSLNNKDGKLIVYHTGKPDDLVEVLASKMSKSLDIVGLEGSKITVMVK